MKKISGLELRSKWNEFRGSKNHKYLPEASLIGGKESTAMFNIAGMQQLIPYLSGKKHPLGTRLFNIQKCIRTVDIDEVGDASHLTFFEMMGNRSLGDYFKKDSIDWSREFLVDVLGFDPEKLAATVFQGDDGSPIDQESAGYWKKYLPSNRIAYLPAKNNRRSPGPVGPCGPDSEIFYRVGKSKLPPQDSNPGTDEDNRLEVRNNVFMEYYRSEDGKLTKLDNQNVDTGMGFERMCKVLQSKDSVYDTDIFDYILKEIEKYLKLKYIGNEKKFRIISDHIRTSFFMIKDGINPSNEGRGYVLRRLIRRMYYSLISLEKLSESDLKKLFTNICSSISTNFDLKIDIQTISDTLQKECIQFQKTIDNGQRMLSEILEKNSKTKLILGKDAFMLYDTFGFPLELTKEIAKENGFQIDEDGFQQEMQLQQDRSRKGSKDKFTIDVDRGKHVAGLSATKFLGYKNLNSDNPKLLKDFDVNGQRILVFDSSPFYAESGGQNGDIGTIILDSGERLEVIDVKKYEGVFLHFVK
ncbi:MAG: alanine--tRNA ligase [Candidatus Absconditicoccaceae bacterium]